MLTPLQNLIRLRFKFAWLCLYVSETTKDKIIKERFYKKWQYELVKAQMLESIARKEGWDLESTVLL